MKEVNYDLFAKTFAISRNNMKWEEIYYFFGKIWKFEWLHILDIWCWSWRLLSHIKEYFNWNFFYTWIDVSSEMIKEAKKLYKDYEFLLQDMVDLSLDKKYDLVFLIASFHHLDSIEKRFNTLQRIKKIIKKDSIIFLTNWALWYKKNLEKYKKNIIPNSINEFGSVDYNIKIWKFYRYYHSFSLDELDYLFKKSWFEIIENRLFENDKNIISILKNKD